MRELSRKKIAQLVSFARKYEVYLKVLILVLIVISVYLFVQWYQVPFDITKPQLFSEWASNQGANFTITVFIINLLVILVPFLPNDPIHMAAGLVMPWWQAFLLIHFCSMIGWSTNYFLGKKLGADFVHLMIGEKNSKVLEQNVIKAKPKHFIFLAWTPGVSYDILGYIAGITKADFKSYFIGALIGTIPTTLLSISYGTLTNIFWWITPLMLTINGIAFLGLGSWIVYKSRKIVSK